MTFQWPLMLLSLALIPLTIAAYLFVQRRRHRYALRFTNLNLLESVMGRGPGLRRHVPPALYLLSLGALLFSLARPMAMISVPSVDAMAMLVVDVSESMNETDIRPSRMEAAKQASLALIDALPEGAQVGLVTFSDGANLRAPLTSDHEVVRRAVRGLTEGGGTAMGEGLYLALDELAQRERDRKGDLVPATIVLMSDGVSKIGRPPLEAAQRARAENARVYTVGVGQSTGNSAPLKNPLNVLDEPTLREIADLTSAQYFYAADASQLERIYANLGSQVSWVQEQTEVTALVSALGAVLLLVGGFLSLLWLHRLP